LATADSEKPTEGDQVSDTTAPAPAVEEAVEAAKANMVEAARPAFYTAPRLEFTKAKYLENSVRAKLGDDAARQYVMAADDTTSNNAGLIPTRQLTEIVNPLSNADRPTIDAISRGVLPDAGMTFEIPKITAVPTVADVNEAQPIAEDGLTNSFISVNVNKYAGGQTFSVELLDRSSPVFFDELVRQMEFAYAKATNAFVSGEIANNGTLNATATTEDKDGLLTFVSTGAAAVYKASLGFARNLVVSAEQWAKIMSYNDAGRPIYTASQPQNAGGVVSPQSIRGNVLGLDLYVDRAMGGTGGTGLGDYSMVVLNPEGYTWYESSRFRLQTNVALNGQIEVAYYGYGALATKVGASANWFNKS
jgi:HK97 family phage major capsid protein